MRLTGASADAEETREERSVNKSLRRRQEPGGANDRWLTCGRGAREADRRLRVVLLERVATKVLLLEGRRR